MVPVSSPSSWLRLVPVVFLPFAAGYFLSYLYRTVNGVIADSLMQELGLGPAGLGVLTSAYFVAFASIQIPLGVLLDRFGPRRVEAGLLLIAALGAMVFAAGHDTPTLAAGRALIGLGVSSCLMAAVTANVLWWPAARLPLANGCLMAFGGLGVVAATTPVAALLPVLGWRGLFVSLAVLTAATAALLWAVVPEKPRHAPPARLSALLSGTLAVFSSRLFWRIVPANVLVQSSFMAYIGLWMGGWLRDVVGYDRILTATTLQNAALAMIAGFFISGGLAGKVAQWGLAPSRLASLGLALCVGLQALVLALWGLDATDYTPIVWIAYTFMATFSVLILAFLPQRFPRELAGRVNTAVNVLYFGLAFLLQAGVGLVVDDYPRTAQGTPAPEGHVVALLFLVVLQILGLIWHLWPREPLVSGHEDR